MANAAPVCDSEPDPDSYCPTGYTISEGSNSANTMNYSSSSRSRCIFSHGGEDKVRVGRSSSIVEGGSGSDDIKGGRGSDTLSGRDGNDVLDGQSGNDFIYGSFGNDTIVGGNGHDWLVPGPGADIVSGGSGNDTVVLYDVCELQAGKIFNGGSGTNTLRIPVSLTEAQSKGLRVSNFSKVVVDDSLRTLSPCFEDPWKTEDFDAWAREQVEAPQCSEISDGDVTVNVQGNLLIIESALEVAELGEVKVEIYSDADQNNSTSYQMTLNGTEVLLVQTNQEGEVINQKFNIGLMDRLTTAEVKRLQQASSSLWSHEKFGVIGTMVEQLPGNNGRGGNWHIKQGCNFVGFASGMTAAIMAIGVCDALTAGVGAFPCAKGGGVFGGWVGSEMKDLCCKSAKNAGKPC